MDAPVVRAGIPGGEFPHVPVAIVGGGACGLTAALSLADQGIDCVVLERDAAPSGSTALSSGFIPAPGTRVQRARGIDDSPERFLHDIQAKAHGTAAPDLARAYTRAIGPALDALQERLQAGLEHLVIVRTAEPAQGAELHVTDAAHGADPGRRAHAPGPR